MSERPSKRARKTEKGAGKGGKPKPRDDASSAMDTEAGATPVYNLRATGLFSGVRLQGLLKSVRGAWVEVSGEGSVLPGVPECLLPPTRSTIDKLRDAPGQWAPFLRSLGSIKFYAGMSLEERAAWVQEHAAPRYDSMRGTGARLHLVHPGRGTFQERLSPAQVERWMAGPLSAEDVLGMFESLSENQGAAVRRADKLARRASKAKPAHARRRSKKAAAAGTPPRPTKAGGAAAMPAAVASDARGASSGAGGREASMAGEGSSADEDVDMTADGAGAGAGGGSAQPAAAAAKPKVLGMSREVVLITHPHFWRIAGETPHVACHSGPVCDLTTGEWSDGATAPAGSVIYLVRVPARYTKRKGGRGVKWDVVEEQEVGVLSPAPGRRWVMPQPDDALGRWLSRAGASLLKSLLQKLVRLAPRHLDAGDGVRVSLPVAVMRVFNALLASPGCFVPHLRRFITGAEAALKRFVVIVGEDADIRPFRKTASAMLAAALVAQRVPGWYPSKKLIRGWSRAAATAASAAQALRYDIPAGLARRPFVVKAGAPALQNVSACLDAAASFAGDLGLFRHIAATPSESLLAVGAPPTAGATGPRWRPEVMPIHHVHDQHCTTGVAWLVEPRWVEGGFAPFLKRLFRQVTGFNPRRLGRLRETDPFVAAARAAQALTDAHLVPPTRERPSEGEQGFEHSLHPAALAAMLGPWSYKERALVAPLVNADTGFCPVAIPRPSRNAKQPTLPPKLAEEATTAFKQLLRTAGMRIRYPIADKYKGCIVRLQSRHATQPAPTSGADSDSSGVHSGSGDDDDEVLVLHLKGGEKQLWQGVGRHLELRLPVHPPLGSERVAAAKPDPAATHPPAHEFFGSGVQRGADEELHKLCVSTGDVVLRRVLSYLVGYDTTLALHRIGMDGKGVDAMVLPEDTQAYAALLRISELYPGALRRTGLGKFRSPVPPLLWHVRDMMREYQLTKQRRDRAPAPGDGGRSGAGAGAGAGSGLGSGAAAAGPAAPPTQARLGRFFGAKARGWPRIADRRGRTAWAHQSEAVRRMNLRGGNFLCAPVGMGKTYIIAATLARMQAAGCLPPRVFMALPASAVSSVCVELRAFGLPVAVLKLGGSLAIPDGATEVKTPPAYYVTLVEHDTMRRVKARAALEQHALDFVFVCDEVHKAMNKTQRTSMALSLARLSVAFVVLTGTPIVDSRAIKLVNWLKLIVPYPVNTANFWVAAAEMIAFTVSTGVRVTYKEHVPTMPPRLLTQYQELVSPRFGGRNANPRQRDFKRAMDLDYEVCDRRMAELAAELAGPDAPGAMVVARSIAHQAKLEELIRGRGVPASAIVLLRRGESLHLDATTKTPLRVAIVLMRRPEGFTLTRFGAMVTSVYPSNQASRQQIEGRINRIGQQRSEVVVHKVHCGLLSFILKHHAEAKNMVVALNALHAAAGGIAKDARAPRRA